jgi:ketosteroid isomerase-like protein
MIGKIAVIVSLAVLCGICFAQTNQEEIGRFIQKYDDAWNHKDMAAVERMLAAEYVYFSSKGQVRSRTSLLQEFASPKYKLEAAERTELKVYQTLETAVVSSRWKGHGTFDGKEFHDDQRCSIVLAKGKQGWMVLSEHCTQIVPAQP